MLGNMTLGFIGGLGMGELVIILVIVLIIFGVGKLPEIGSGLGKGIKSFRGAMDDDDDGDDAIDVTPEKKVIEDGQSANTKVATESNSEASKTTT